MIQEQLPDVVDFETPWTRTEVQGMPNTCQTFGITSALEAMLHRIGRNVQLSPRFLWWWSNGITRSIPTLIATANSTGICRDELCPYGLDPYTGKVPNLDDIPSADAIQDAKVTLPGGLAVERIAGREQAMREMAKGSALVVISAGYASEHCEAIIGYDKAKGVKVHGSGGTIYWADWDWLDSAGQLWYFSEVPFMKLQHADYIAATPPTFENGVLSIARARVYKGWPIPSAFVQNVQIKFINFGAIEADDPRVSGDEVVYFESANRLHLPSVIVGGALYRRVSLTGPVAEVLTAETVND